MVVPLVWVALFHFFYWSIFTPYGPCLLFSGCGVVVWCGCVVVVVWGVFWSKITIFVGNYFLFWNSVFSIFLIFWSRKTKKIQNYYSIKSQKSVIFDKKNVPPTHLYVPEVSQKLRNFVATKLPRSFVEILAVVLGNAKFRPAKLTPHQTFPHAIMTPHHPSHTKARLF